MSSSAESREVNTLYGVDGTRNGWVVAKAKPDLSDISIHLVTDLEALFWRVVRDSGLLAIDLPIGLPDSGPRACDRAARAALGPRKSSSVFPAPMRAALQAESYEEACRLNHEASGRKLSRETFHLLPKIREVDALIWPERQERIYEAHPEVTFMTLGSCDQGLATGKKTPEGQAERKAILAEWLPCTDVDALLDASSGGIAPLDDRIDALACLVTASRILNHAAIRLPADTIEIDARGLRMEILA